MITFSSRFLVKQSLNNFIVLYLHTAPKFSVLIIKNKCKTTKQIVQSSNLNLEHLGFFLGYLFVINTEPPSCTKFLPEMWY